MKPTYFKHFCETEPRTLVSNDVARGADGVPDVHGGKRNTQTAQIQSPELSNELTGGHGRELGQGYVGKAVIRRPVNLVDVFSGLLGELEARECLRGCGSHGVHGEKCWGLQGPATYILVSISAHNTWPHAPPATEVGYRSFYG